MHSILHSHKYNLKVERPPWIFDPTVCASFPTDLDIEKITFLGKKRRTFFCLNIKNARVTKPSFNLLKMACFGENAVMGYRQMPGRSERSKQILILVRWHETFPSFRWKHAHSFTTRGSRGSRGQLSVTSSTVFRERSHRLLSDMPSSQSWPLFIC